jgi:hypothetical protein
MENETELRRAGEISLVKGTKDGADHYEVRRGDAVMFDSPDHETATSAYDDARDHDQPETRDEPEPPPKSGTEDEGADPAKGETKSEVADDGA